MYAEYELHMARKQRIYPYKRGEAVVFSGDLYHQTVPFMEPESGWGARQCRALFCVVLVAPDALQKEDQFDRVMQNLKRPTGGYMLDPVTDQWLTPSNSDSDDDGSSECGSDDIDTEDDNPNSHS